MSFRALAVDDQGWCERAEESLDRRGDRIDTRLDSNAKGKRLEERFDTKGNRMQTLYDRRGIDCKPTSGVSIRARIQQCTKQDLAPKLDPKTPCCNGACVLCSVYAKI